ncbi:hypothetical protein K1X84_05335 [bacterium]|nr:hypothetical protein [bacterium]
MLKAFISFCLMICMISCKPETKPVQLKSGDVIFKAPSEWVSEVPTNSMRKAQFKLTGADKVDAELAVFFFPGAGGTVDANLNRWYGQFKQPDGSNTKDKAEKTEVQVNDISVSVVYVTGIYLKPRDPSMMGGGPVDEMTDYAMRAAIVETANGPWFFKAVGPKITIDSHKNSFDEFVKTFEIK